MAVKVPHPAVAMKAVWLGVSLNRVLKTRIWIVREMASGQALR